MTPRAPLVHVQRAGPEKHPGIPNRMRTPPRPVKTGPRRWSRGFCLNESICKDAAWMRNAQAGMPTLRPLRAPTFAGPLNPHASPA